jgi:CubicO group peptidase (beta-lactamase class C family)
MKKIFRDIGAIVLAGGVLISCNKNKDNPTPVTPPLDFSGVEKVLSDSVSLRFEGKAYVSIFVKEQEVYSKGFGGYTADTKQLIGSSTKWLSAAVVMSLVDEGKLQLTDSIGKYLPVFSANGKGRITIAQLFSHTSGFPGESAQGYENDPTLTLEEAVNGIAENVALINPPGTKFHYGGVSMQVGGRIAEIVSGKDWKTLFREKLATPCGMPSTDFGSTSNPVIAGGARSTPSDYSKFLGMILTGGVTVNGRRVLTEAAVTAMIQSQVGVASVEYSPYPPSLLTGAGLYGLGNWRDAPAENSCPGAFGSHPWVNFDKRITGIIFTYVPVQGFTATLPTCFEVRRLSRSIVN